MDAPTKAMSIPQPTWHNRVVIHPPMQKWAVGRIKDARLCALAKLDACRLASL